MASYRVLLKPSVEKDLRPLPKRAVRRLVARIEALAADPFPRGSAKLAGAEALYRVRVGEYRVIYGVDSRAQVVLVHYVRHRKDAYRGL
ncbi:MAG: type II toxin-antitoxin system RelE family toxin [Anaerolineales bacterium]